MLEDVGIRAILNGTRSFRPSFVPSANLGGGRAMSRPAAVAGIGRTERPMPGGGLAAIPNVGEASSTTLVCEVLLMVSCCFAVIKLTMV